MIESLKETYGLKDNYNLMLFLKVLCSKINVMLEELNEYYDVDIFESLNTLKKNRLVNKIIEKIDNVLYDDNITKALVTKLKELLAYKDSEIYPNIFLRTSRTYIESNPNIETEMKNAIKQGIFFYYNDTMEELPYSENEMEVEDIEDVELEFKSGGKKLKKI